MRRHWPPYFARTRYIRPTFANPFPRTRYIRHSIHSPTFAKLWLAFDTFARVIRHFGEFGASGHCLIFTQKFNQSITHVCLLTSYTDDCSTINSFVYYKLNLNFLNTNYFMILFSPRSSQRSLTTFARSSEEISLTKSSSTNSASRDFWDSISPFCENAELFISKYNRNSLSKWKWS